MSKKIITLKITGEILPLNKNNSRDLSHVKSIAGQIKQLRDSHFFGIVVGGGNFFRGKESASLGLSKVAGDQIGMMATFLNGLALQDVFKQEGLRTKLFSSIACPNICDTASQQNISSSFSNADIFIFVGGVGHPGFTNDTSAIVRSIQLNSKEMWKATKTDGLYDGDPEVDASAKRISSISCQEVLDRELKIMDNSALFLAKKNNITIRVFPLFLPDALLKMVSNPGFCSVISPC